MNEPDEEVKLPGESTYDVPPPAVRVAELPLQIVALVNVAVTDGLTVTTAVVEPTQPLVFVTLTVYVVVADGLTVNEPDVDVRPPGESP